MFIPSMVGLFRYPCRYSFRDMSTTWFFREDASRNIRPWGVFMAKPRWDMSRRVPISSSMSQLGRTIWIIDPWGIWSNKWLLAWPCLLNN